MVLPLILLWDKNKLSNRDFIHQLYVYHEANYLSMAQSVGTFSGGPSRINILRAREDGDGYSFSPCWSTTQGTSEVYRPLQTKEVS